MVKKTDTNFFLKGRFHGLFSNKETKFSEYQKKNNNKL